MKWGKWLSSRRLFKIHPKKSKNQNDAGVYPTYRRVTATVTSANMKTPPVCIETATPEFDVGVEVVLGAVKAPEVPLSFLARSLKAVKFRGPDSSELMAKTIPLAQ
jgi:hypothetical protein